MTEPRKRPTRAHEKHLETVIAELVGALDQTTLRWVVFRKRHDARTLAAMKAARESVPEPSPVKPSPMQGEERG